jgi:hypothetical protein
MQLAAAVLRTRLALPIVTTVVLLTAGVPLFLRMPVWCDITLYDMAARTILRGGVHYRDLFDTNTPGYVWLLTVVRSLVGWSSEAVRAVDLLFFTGTMLVLLRLARRGGATGLNGWWLIAGGVGFYLFTEESVHAQRDVWLALPALLAVEQRLKRTTAPRPGVFRPAGVEGVLWAVAVWIKPHFLLVAAAVWLLTVRRLAGRHDRPWRAVFADLLGNLIAGSMMGAAGVGYMAATGTWPHFLDVMTNWNVGYMEGTFGTLDWRLENCLGWFPPWSFLLPPTVLLAAVGLIDARLWSGRFRDPGRAGPFDRRLPGWLWGRVGTDEQRWTRGVLGAVYLVWAAQSLFLQRAFVYAHAVEVLLMLAVWAAHRWNVSALVFAWFLAVNVLWAAIPAPLARSTSDSVAAYKLFTRHPACVPERLRVWPACFRAALTPAERWARQDALRHETEHAAGVTWAELHEVAEFLRGRHAADRELVCWDDSPHPLYLMLGVEPGLRFMHVNTARGIADGQAKVVAEMHANPAVRFVVADLRWHWFQIADAAERARYAEPGPSPDDLLPPAAQHLRDRPDQWPFDTRLTVFRSGAGRGRYVVFAVR